MDCDKKKTKTNCPSAANHNYLRPPGIILDPRDLFETRWTIWDLRNLCGTSGHLGPRGFIWTPWTMLRDRKKTGVLWRGRGGWR